ncbi:MAG TPA: alpha/beta hydrolase [Solirubrobacterales bacterium]
MVIANTKKGAEGERMIRVGREMLLCCRIDNPSDGVPLLLVAGLGQQLVEWPPELLDGLRAAGFRLIRFDNRDVGRSGRDPIPAPGAREMLSRRFRGDRYDLGHMALDTAALLDGLEIDAAHVVGMSMGGMIGQTLAARHPSRVVSLTSIMSTTGARRIGRPALSSYLHLFRPVAAERDAAASQTVAAMRHIGSRGFPFDEERVRAVALEMWDREGGTNADGPARQLAAIFRSGDRTAEVERIAVPTLVIHGDRDRMVNPTGGWATSRAIRGSRLLTVRGMGHDLPAGACPELVEAIAEHCRAAERRLAATTEAA